MRRRLLRSWVEFCYHAPIELDRYLALGRRDRFALHAGLADFVEELNQVGAAEPDMGGAPRAVRRGY